MNVHFAYVPCRRMQSALFACKNESCSKAFDDGTNCDFGSKMRATLATKCEATTKMCTRIERWPSVAGSKSWAHTTRPVHVYFIQLFWRARQCKNTVKKTKPLEETATRVRVVSYFLKTDSHSANTQSFHRSTPIVSLCADAYTV